MSDAIRIYMTGTCEGFDKLRDALAPTTSRPGCRTSGRPPRLHRARDELVDVAGA